MTQFQTILCPVDPAASSDIALHYAMALGDWLDARVTVLAVRPHGWRIGRRSAASRTGSEAAEALTALEQRLRQVSRPSVDLQVVEGAVGREIVRGARDLQADLLVMSARRLGRIEQLLFGSVIEHVLRHTACPVLLVPPEAGSPPATPAEVFDRIVCGVDRSPDSRRALAYALALGRRQVTVVHALEDFADEHARFARHFNTVACWREVEAEIRADYEALVPEQARLWCAIDVAVPFGRAGLALIDAADASRATLLVIGTAGLHTPLGATTRYVIQKAPCPVLAVPHARTRTPQRPTSQEAGHT